MYDFLVFGVFLLLNVVLILANCADPGEMLAAFHLDLPNVPVKGFLLKAS